MEWVPVPVPEAGGPPPEMVRAGGGAPSAEVSRVLGLVQEWLAADRPAGERLAVVTRGAVPVAAGEGVTDLAGSAVWGLVRSAQSENPGRLILADLPPGGGDEVGGDEQLAAALASDEPELAIRDGQVYARRLVRPSGALVPPGGGGPWRLETTGTGTLDGLALVPCPQAAAPLEPGQVRVAVRAAGLNFRDVLIGLGMYPGGGIIGSELAGVVLDTGPGVTGLTRGDRVTGLTEGGFGPVTVTRAPLLTRIPAGWSFARAASVPIVFATAWYALADLGQARPGQKLLVHAAAGGVGMAAVAIARRLGLEVYATASPGQARRAGRPGPGRDPYRVVAGRRVRGEVPRRHRRHRRGYRAERAGRGAHRRVPAAPPARRRVRRDGQDRRPGPSAGRRGPSRRDLPGLRPGRGRPGPAGRDPGAGDGPAGGRRAAPAAGALLGHPPRSRGVPVHEPGPAHRQARADHPARPIGSPRTRHGAGHRRHRDAGRPDRRAPGRHRPGPAPGAGLPLRAPPPRAPPHSPRPGHAPGRRSGRAGRPRCGSPPATPPTGTPWPPCWPASPPRSR